MRKSRKSRNAWKCRLRTSGGRRGPHNQVRQSTKIGAIASCALCNFRSSEGTEGKRKRSPLSWLTKVLLDAQTASGRMELVDELMESFIRSSVCPSLRLPNSPTVLAFAQNGCPRQNIPRFLGLPCFSPQIMYLPAPTTSCHLAITPLNCLITVVHTTTK